MRMNVKPNRLLWISTNQEIPSINPDMDDMSVHVLISDGMNISVGYVDYTKVDPEDRRSNSKAWVDNGKLVKLDKKGYPKVTHWAKMPVPPSSTCCS